MEKSEEVPKKSRKKLLLAILGIVVPALVSTFIFIGLHIYSQPPNVKLQSIDGTFTDSTERYIRVTVGVENLNYFDVKVKLRFETSWNDTVQDTEYETVTLDSRETKLVSCVLQANPVGGETLYEVNTESVEKA